MTLLSEGLSDREIGQRLSLALDTVKWYNKRLYRKLGVGNRTEAAGWARSLGLLDQEAGPASVTRPSLPAQVTSFVGRERELSEIRRSIEKSRLVSITGPGGVGKTRLGLQVAASLAPKFHDGIFFVPLQEVTELEQLPWAIAQRVGLGFNPESAPLAQFLEHFSEKSSLLLLDEFEHLMPAANILADILEAAPKLKLLVTTRQRLNLYGEVAYAIGGLALPEGDGEGSSEAVDLFMQRAGSANPAAEFTEQDAEHIARICRLVGGLPLAIELASTWVDVLTPREIADELERDLDLLETGQRGTQSSLRSAIGRSWDLLDASEQRAFRRLSVFRGGFTRTAAESVAGVDLTTLQALVAKSLLGYERAASRYDFHGLLRGYAAEKLEVGGEARKYRAAHARYFAEFMAEHWRALQGKDQGKALLEVEADTENARAAWGYAWKAGDWPLLLRLLPGLWAIHDIRGSYPSGIGLFEPAVRAARESSEVEAQAGLGALMAAEGFFRAASGYGARKGFEQARAGVEMLRSMGSRSELVIPLISLFVAAASINEGGAAAAAAEECLELARELNDSWATAKGLQLQALWAIREEQLDRAEQLGVEALRLCERGQDRWSESVLCIEILSLVPISRGDYDAAESWVRRGLQAAEQIDFRYSIETAAWQLGYIEALRGNYAEAGNYWNQVAKSDRRATGGWHMMGFTGSAGSGWDVTRTDPAADDA